MKNGITATSINREQNNQNSAKSKLLHVAEHLFAKHGFDATSTRLIAENSGMNLSMINYYFRSKESLYIFIFQTKLNELTEELENIDNLPLQPAEKLETYLNASINRIRLNQGFYRMVVRQITMNPDTAIMSLVSSGRDKHFKLLQKIVQTGIGQGCFRQVDVELFTLDVLYLLPALFTSPLAAVGSLEPELVEDTGQDANKRIIAHIMSSLVIPQHPTI